MPDTYYDTTRGSDVLLTFSIVDSASDPIDLTGMTVAFIDVASALSGRITGTITDAAGGVFTVAIDGTDPITLGDHGFRVQITCAGASIGLPKSYLRVT